MSVVFCQFLLMHELSQLIKNNEWKKQNKKLKLIYQEAVSQVNWAVLYELVLIMKFNVAKR